MGRASVAGMDDLELVHAFFDHLADGRIDEWMATLTDDVSADTPFAPTGLPRRFEGTAEVRTRFGDARERMQSLEFYDRVLHRTDGGPVVATCKSRGVRGDGSPYKNDYCWLFTIDSGLISHWVEYYDPQELARRG